MKYIIPLFFILFWIPQSRAQYTEIINSKRPGFSDSPYAVGTKVMQFEAGFLYRENNDLAPWARPYTYGGELLFRYGVFSEKMEVDVYASYQEDHVKAMKDFNLFDLTPDEYGNYLPYDEATTINGFSDVAVGVKYLLFEQEFEDKRKEVRSWKKRTAFDKKRLIPSVGILVGVHTDLVSADYKDDLSFKGAVLLQNDFSNRFVLVTNLFADRIGSMEEYYSYYITMTYAMNMQWSFFFENQGKYPKYRDTEYQLGGGLAYLWSEDLQFDISARTNIFADYSYAYFSTGFSWRWDKHVDTYTIKNAPSPPKTKRKKKGFFSRLFGG